MTSQHHQRRSTFSATCSRLSQYLKDQGGLTARPLPTTVSLVPDAPAETIMQPMDLFPQHAGFGSEAATVEKKAQLTIFYGGQVLVFDEFPADKAMDLMKMASAESSKGSLTADTPARTTTNLPIARRASLHRFLQKRKDRINSKAPYQVAGSQDSSKPQATLPWFRLGEQVPKPVSSSESCRRARDEMCGSAGL